MPTTNEKYKKYRIIETNRGILAYIAHKDKLIRLIPPCSDLCHYRFSASYDENLLPALADKLVAYFAGKPVNFDDIACDLSGLSEFTQKVLTATRKIPYGGTISYSELAKIIDAPRAARAIGNALAKNPIPIVIPCHRIIRADGSVGGYSGSSDSDFKRELINLEKQALQSLQTKIQKR